MRLLPVHLAIVCMLLCPAAAAAQVADAPPGLQHPGDENELGVALAPGQERALRESLTAALGDGFATHESPHFLTAYRAERSWALGRVLLLEATFDRFTIEMQRLGLEPQQLPHKLECVLFGEYDDFKRYAREVDRIDVGFGAGYYSSRTNRVAFFNDHTSPVFRGTVEQIERLQSRIAQISQQLKHAGGDRGLRASLEQQLQEAKLEIALYERRRELMAQQGDSAKTTHEAAHQLAFNTGVQNPKVRYPFWLAEGLACSFEAEAVMQPFGPSADNANRRRMLLQAYERNTLTPLADFVGMRIVKTERAKPMLVLYAQAWGLFHYLYNNRSADLRRYLTTLAALPPGDRDEETLQREFISFFGPIADVERQWFLYLRELQRVE